MTVYVDGLIAWPQEAESEYASRWFGNGRPSCHLFADTEDELHEFAGRLGLKRSWFQSHHEHPHLHHYDLTLRKRGLAVRLGAVEINAMEWARRHMESAGN